MIDKIKNQDLTAANRTPWLGRRRLLPVGIIAIALLLSASAYYIYVKNKIVNQERANIANIGEQDNGKNNFKQGGVASSSASQAIASTSAAGAMLMPAIGMDDDFDSLFNDEEKKYGTNPKKSDTDGDGLVDYSEVMVFHTDPLNPDTDHDGYNDWEEIKKGFNPNGAGKLK